MLILTQKTGDHIDAKCQCGCMFRIRFLSLYHGIGERDRITDYIARNEYAMKVGLEDSSMNFDFVRSDARKRDGN